MTERESQVSLVVNNDHRRPYRADKAEPLFFDRQELSEILTLYGQGLVRGEWRDYGISADRYEVTFSFFRRSREQALYRLVKAPALRHKQSLYRLVAPDGFIMKRGVALGSVLTALKPRTSI